MIYYAVICSDLTNEDNEKFVFGIHNGVRGFYTDPSRADDCFVPFYKFDPIKVVYSYGTRNAPSVSYTFQKPGIYHLITGFTNEQVCAITSDGDAYGTNIKITNGSCIFDTTLYMWVVTANENCTITLSASEDQTSRTVVKYMFIF